MLKEIDHPYARGEKVYDVTFENVQAGLRTDYLFRIANQRGGIVLGTGRPLRARARLGDLWRRRPDEPLQRQRRRPEDADPAPDSLGCQLGSVRRRRQPHPDRDPRDRDQPRARARRGAPVDRVEHRPLRAARLHALSRPALRLPAVEDRLPRHRTRGATSSAATGRRTSPRASALAYDEAEIRKWLEVFCKRFFGFAQFKRSALPNGPKVSHGGSLSPRGDWRAPSDTSADAWLRDLERWTVD